MVRPKCRRCGKSLDLWCEMDDDGKFRTRLICNGKVLATDAEFTERWNNLPGDDVARLTRQLIKSGEFVA